MIYSLGDRKVTAQGNYFVADNAAVIGSVVLHADVSVWFNAVVRGDNDVISIGEQSNIQDSAVLHVDEGIPLTLEAKVSVGHLAMLHGCCVGYGSLIGIGATVLDHAVIGRHCLIGANALITERKVIPERSLVLGSPGRVVRPLTDAEVDSLLATAAHYAAKSAMYRTQLVPQSQVVKTS